MRDSDGIYSLSITTIPVQELLSIQGQPTLSFLQEMGSNKHFSCAIVFGPQEKGGLALRHLPAAQGISRIMFLLKHVYNATKTWKLILITLNSLHLEAGSGHLLLADLVP